MNNKEQKIAKVICLPTSDVNVTVGQLYLNELRRLCISDFSTKTLSLEDRGMYLCKPQHIYITTDEEIKEGDWCINGSNVCRYVQKAWTKNAWLKIIASTDPRLDLINRSPDRSKDIIFPKPPQSFIEEYCKRGGISKAEVEYVMVGINDYRPSICPIDNTINIREIEEEKMYSRSEVIQLLSDSNILSFTDGVETGKTGKVTSDNFILSDWVKENL